MRSGHLYASAKRRPMPRGGEVYLGRALYGADAHRGRRPRRPTYSTPTSIRVMVLLALVARASARAEWAGVTVLVEARRQRVASRVAAALELERMRRAELARAVADAPEWAAWCGEHGMPAGAWAWSTISAEAAGEQ